MGTARNWPRTPNFPPSAAHPHSDGDLRLALEHSRIALGSEVIMWMSRLDCCAWLAAMQEHLVGGRMQRAAHRVLVKDPSSRHHRTNASAASCPHWRNEPIRSSALHRSAPCTQRYRNTRSAHKGCWLHDASCAAVIGRRNVHPSGAHWTTRRRDPWTNSRWADCPLGKQDLRRHSHHRLSKA